MEVEHDRWTCIAHFGECGPEGLLADSEQVVLHREGRRAVHTQEEHLIVVWFRRGDVAGGSGAAFGSVMASYLMVRLPDSRR